MLRGEYVILRFPQNDDVQIFSAWKKDSEVAKYLPFTYPVSRKALENILMNFSRNKDGYLFIIENEDEIPVGACCLKNIDWINGTAEAEVVIYAKNCWGRGYGYDALKTLTAFGMNDLNLYVIYAYVMEDNERAIKCFEKAGYELEGVLHDRIYKEGMRKNIVCLSISKGKSPQYAGDIRR